METRNQKNGAFLNAIVSEVKPNTMNLKFCQKGISLLLVTSFIFLSGCASIVSKGTYPISVNSTPSGAKITVKDKKGSDVFTGNTPANFKLKAGAGFFAKASYSVTFEMEGYESKTVPVNFSMDGWYVGNILFGGLIGFLIIDPASGAMWKLDTEFLNETLSGVSTGTEEASLKVLELKDVPDSWESNLVRIN